MLTASKWLLIIGSALLIIGSLARFAGINEVPFTGWTIPCPVSLLLLGVGILLFAIGSKAFKK
jgi:hypothetical protein